MLQADVYYQKKNPKYRVDDAGHCCEPDITYVSAQSRDKYYEPQPFTDNFKIKIENNEISNLFHGNLNSALVILPLRDSSKDHRWVDVEKKNWESTLVVIAKRFVDIFGCHLDEQSTQVSISHIIIFFPPIILHLNIHIHIILL